MDSKFFVSVLLLAPVEMWGSERPAGLSMHLSESADKGFDDDASSDDSSSDDAEEEVPFSETLEGQKEHEEFKVALRTLTREYFRLRADPQADGDKIKAKCRELSEFMSKSILSKSILKR